MAAPFGLRQIRFGACPSPSIEILLSAKKTRGLSAPRFAFLVMFVPVALGRGAGEGA